MGKEELNKILEVMESTVLTKREELGVAMSNCQVAREELANAGKPVVSESMIANITEQLTEMFSDTLANADPCDMSPEFSLSYNEISLDCLDMSSIGISESDIHSILEDFFAIKEDEDEDDDNS